MEHICLLKAKEALSDEEENDMLDYLYTTQYQMGGIIAISLGKLLLSLIYIIITIISTTDIGLYAIKRRTLDIVYLF